MIHERAREHRKHAQEADLRFSDASKRLSELKNSGIRSQTAEQILSKLQQDVKDLNDRKDSVERISMERESHLEKLQSWDNADRVTTEDDVHMKRDQVNALEDEVSSLQERMDAQLERNTRLVVFRQASAMALKKFREREDEVDKLQEELRRLQRQTEEKDAEQKAQGKNNAGKMGKRDLKKYGAIVREKIEKYKKMKEDLSALRAEVVVLQRTEEILKSRHKNLDDFLDKLAAENGVAVSGLLMVLSYFRRISPLLMLTSTLALRLRTTVFLGSMYNVVLCSSSDVCAGLPRDAAGHSGGHGAGGGGGPDEGRHAGGDQPYGRPDLARVSQQTGAAAAPHSGAQGKPRATTRC
jgi:hypothetical protein